MNNGNNTLATITPLNRNGSKSASAHNAKGTTPGKGPDATKKSKLKLDARLEPIREKIESQPKAIQDTLGDTAVAMLLATHKLRERRTGLVNMTRNVTTYPCSCNLKAKLAFPQEMKEDPETKENEKVWNDFIQKTKDEMKKQVLKQGQRIVKFLTEKRLDMFHEQVLIIAEGYIAWYSEIEGLKEPPRLSNHAYGAASIYCYLNAIGPQNGIFDYLCQEQEALLTAFKKKYLTTTAGTPLFTDTELQEMTMLLPDTYKPGTPHRLAMDELLNENHRNPNDDELDDRTITQASQVEATTNLTAAPPPMPADLEHVIYKVRGILDDLVPTLFVNLASYVETSQREKTANAKLEATLKSKKALDMAKVLDSNMAAQDIVAPENMRNLVHSIVDQRIDNKGKQAQKQFTKSAIKDARKKSLGGAGAVKTPPGNKGSGGKQKGAPTKVSFGLTQQQAKRAKKQNSKEPERDYEQLQRQRKTPNPYLSPSTYGRASNPGRGRGSGRGRGASSRGRGRGRGRF
jgi:hypothetical protein